MNTSRLQRFSLRTSVPVACSVVAGMLFYGTDVFNTHHSAFQFLWNAVVASLFYHLLAFTRFRDAILGWILLVFLTLLTTHSTDPTWMLRDILYMASIGVTVLLYIRYFRQGEHLGFLYPAATFAGLYAMVYLIAGSMQHSLMSLFGNATHALSFTLFASSIVFWGSLIGFAVGVGFALSTALFGPISAKPDDLPA